MTGIVIVNKPEGWTSFDVVAKLRRILGERRIGHGGTLDPMATGVLPVFVGRATRAVAFMEAVDKEYEALCRFGIVTDTQDTTGTILETRPVALREEDIQAALRGFSGESMQLPPLYSAVKVDGKKLYEYARRGKDVERQARRIFIHSVAPLGFCGGDYRFRIVCSKGTYIRTICHDLGEKLGCGAAMSGLLRRRVGVFRLDDAVSLADVEERGAACLLPVDRLFSDYPALTVSAAEELRIRCGNDVRCPAKAGKYRLYSETSEFLAYAESDGIGLHVIKSFFEV